MCGEQAWLTGSTPMGERQNSDTKIGTTESRRKNQVEEKLGRCEEQEPGREEVGHSDRELRGELKFRGTG